MRNKDFGEKIMLGFWVGDFLRIYDGGGEIQKWLSGGGRRDCDVALPRVLLLALVGFARGDGDHARISQP